MAIKDFKVGNLWAKSFTDASGKQPTKAYKIWADIVTRCKEGGKYQTKKPTYRGCVMSDNFKDFQYFADWCQHQVGYSLTDYQIDKDILSNGDKLYSEDFCVFIPKNLNSFMADRTKERVGLPVGVQPSKNSKFVARISRNNKRVRLGTFSSAEDAGNAYKIAKKEDLNIWINLLQTPDFPVDSRVIEALRKLT